MRKLSTILVYGLGAVCWLALFEAVSPLLAQNQSSIVPAQLPDPSKLPQDGSQIVSWIAIACVAAMLSAFGIGAKWLITYLNGMRDDSKATASLFASESKAARESFERVTEAGRVAHANAINEINTAAQKQLDKAITAFEKALDKIGTGVGHA